MPIQTQPTHRVVLLGQPAARNLLLEKPEKKRAFSFHSRVLSQDPRMKLQRGTLSLLSVLLLFLVVAGAVAYRLLSQDEATANPTTPELPSTEGVDVVSTDQWMGAQPVEGVPVRRDTLWLKVSAAGQAAASRQSIVAARSPGVVMRVSVRENSQVGANAVLVQLDTVI